MVIIFVNIMSSIYARGLALPFQKVTENEKNVKVLNHHDAQPTGVVSSVPFACPVMISPTLLEILE